MNADEPITIDPLLLNNPTKEARGLRLKFLRKLAGLSRRDIEEKYEIKEVTLRSWERGNKTGLTEQGAKRMVLVFREEGFQCSLGWLMHGNGSVIKTAKEIISTYSFSENNNGFCNEEELKINKEVALFCEHIDDALVYRIDDDSMAPFFNKGDLVAGKKHYAENIKSCVGLYCIIETQMGLRYCRLLQWNVHQKVYQLQSIDPYSKSISPIFSEDDIFSAAPIIWFRRACP